MKNWKTTLTGLIFGGIPIVQALINAYQAGQFTGKNGQQIAIGCGIIIFGMVAKDHNVTGGSTKQ